MNQFTEIMRFYKEIGVEFMEKRPAGHAPAKILLKDGLNAAVKSNPNTDGKLDIIGDLRNNGNAAPPDEPQAGQKDPLSMEDVFREIRSCKKCKLHETKKNYVPGEGGGQPDILFIGEGPGETEDNFGRPFIGNAGQLLDKLIEKMGYNRDTVFICNIVKCRPPGNREPHADEAAACRPYLIKQIRLLKPKVIVCLGRIALNHLMEASYSIMEKRGQRFDFDGFPMIPTFHPSYILHQKTKEAATEAKWHMWRDMETVLKIIGKPLK